MSSLSDVWQHAHTMLRAARKTINDSLGSLGLSSTEGNILLHLMTGSDGLRQDEIVDQLDLSKGAVSRSIDVLVSKNYLLRRSDTADRRVNRIFLTDQAREIGPRIRETYDHLYDRALSGISEDDLKHFIGVFRRIAGNFAD